MKKLCITVVAFVVMFLTVQFSNAQLIQGPIDTKGEWKYKDKIIKDGNLYAIEKCEQTIFGTCTIGAYQAVLIPTIAE
jgi:hypothetical protein